jgi:DNA-binding response OmpR family regulator
VCLDLMLPESSGYEVCAQIRKMPGMETLPVLIVSSRSLPLDRALAEEAGSTAYLIKPVRWKSFAATVKQFVDGA